MNNQPIEFYEFDTLPPKFCIKCPKFMTCDLKFKDCPPKKQED